MRFLPSFCAFEQLALGGDVAAVALRGHVYPEGAHGLARDHLAADRGLDLTFFDLPII
jgi:hypothetical protein